MDSERWRIWVILLVAAAAGGGAYWYLRGSSPAPAAALPDAGPPAIVAAPDAEIPVPKSPAEGDELLRKHVAEASKSPVIAGYVASADMVQRLAAAAKLVSSGASPRPVLSFIELEGKFAVDERTDKETKAERITIAPASYARYDGLVDTFTSIDTAYAGRSYRELRPYFDSSFAQVAKPGERFDDVLVEAINRLVSVKVPAEPPDLVLRGAIYLFKDPSLESLSAAEKHVLRMGPRNAAAFQETLRKFALSAGLSLQRR